MSRGGKDRRWLEVVRSALPAAAILLLVGALYVYHRQARELSRRANALQEAAEARALRSRLIGKRLPDVSFADLDGRARPVLAGRSRLRVLWIVDPTSCVDCLRDLSGWRALSRHPGLQSSVILLGVDRATARRVRRGVNLGEADVRRDGDGAATRKLAGRRPARALALLVGPDRRVLAAEVRGPRGGCDWTSLARFIALLEVADEAGAAAGAGAGESSRAQSLTSAEAK